MVCSTFENCHRILSCDTTVLKPHCINNCLKYRDKRSYAKAEERGKSIIFRNDNNNEVACYRVDGGIVGPDTCKCDNLLLFIDEKQAIFIELKGVNVTHALEQIKNAVKLLGEDLSNFDWHGRVIASSGIPNIKNDPKFINLWKVLKSHNLNATLLVRENRQTEKLSSLKGA